MFRSIVLFTVLAAVSAFAPAGRNAQRSVSMLIGAPSKGEIVSLNADGIWDPLNLAKGKDEATINWFRAAELKHGRVSMLATLGVIIQANVGPSGINWIPGFPVTETNAFATLKQFAEVNSFGLIQIVLAIAAVEVLGASIERSKGGRPGDFGWDPANIRPSSEEALDELQVKELKNGRLAMLSIAGMAYQAALTGQGTLEQLSVGHISPFGDGQGAF